MYTYSKYDQDRSATNLYGNIIAKESAGSQVPTTYNTKPTSVKKYNPGPLGLSPILNAGAGAVLGGMTGALLGKSTGQRWGLGVLGTVGGAVIGDALYAAAHRRARNKARGTE